ncbi:MAG: hypothetical protein SGBAC_009569 [Bacillariaceae sp.]
MSSSIVLDDVDDYLAPSQACINPLFQPPEDEKTRTKTVKIIPRRRRRRTPISDQAKQSTTNGPSSKTEIFPIDKAEIATTNEQKEKDSAVKASIADCLACSGCVTTAETVLLEQRHSLQSLRQKLQLPRGKFRAITVSPNSWADMCRHWKLFSSSVSSNRGIDNSNGNRNNRNVDRVRLQFTTMLNQILNADIVVDGNLPLQWTWLDEAQEFVEFYRVRKRHQTDPQSHATDEEQTNDVNTGEGNDPPLPSTAVDGTKTTYYLPDGTAKTVDNTNDEYYQIGTPLISGSCPATVCLVEKSRSKFVPHLSRTQSPMSMMGSVLKREEQVHYRKQKQGPNESHNSRIVTETAADMWDHWAIMPCHDKKLEASRQDFVLPNPERSAVDLVITTAECVELIEQFVQSKINDDAPNAEWTVASYLQDLPLAKQEAIAAYDRIPSNPPSEPTYWTTSISSLVLTKNQSTSNEASKSEGTIPFAYSSGSHADFIFLYAAHELFGCVLDAVSWKPAEDVKIGHEAINDSSDSKKRVIRSARLARAHKQHYYKARLFRQEDGKYSQNPPALSCSPPSPVLEFSIAHGMQTMQRALKDLEDIEFRPDNSNGSGSTMRYLEAMACPHGGCINGGGAISTRNTSVGAVARETPTEMRQRVQNSLRFLDLPSRPSYSFQHIAVELRGRTRYHAVPQMQHTLGATAGVKVEDIQW